MKLSAQPTDFLILIARTNSEWDECHFAIVHMSENWKKQMRERLNVIAPFKEDFTFVSMNYYDGSVQFYQDNEVMPDSSEFREEKSCSFLNISDEELDGLSLPENSLDCYTLIVERGGWARYNCYGKHTDEKFWTTTFSIEEVLQPFEGEKAN